MSGKKGCSGRKSNADVARAREIFRSVIPDAHGRKMIENLDAVLVAAYIEQNPEGS